MPRPAISRGLTTVWDFLAAGVHFANCADQLVGRLRLHDVAVRARFDGPDGDLIFGMHAHDEDAGVGPRRADALDQIEERDARHPDIEQDDVGFVVRQHGEELDGVARFGDDAQLRIFRHELPEARAHDRVIVGDDDANHADACGSGTWRRTVVPPPSRGAIVNWPPQRMARSRMPSSPSAWGSSRRAGSIPTPSSCTSSARPRASSCSVTVTAVARAWRAMLVSDSWSTRNAAVAMRSSNGTGSPPMCTVAGPPARRPDPSPRHWVAGTSPRSSRMPGRSSVARRCVAAIVPSTSAS